MFDHSTGRMARTVTKRADSPRVLDRVQEALEGMQFGQVTVIVQDGIVVQVERTDRMRLPRQTRPR